MVIQHLRFDLKAVKERFSVVWDPNYQMQVDKDIEDCKQKIREEQGRLHHIKIENQKAKAPNQVQEENRKKLMDHKEEFLIQ